mmetsp:Transcript_5768/g.8389  ORF Transcript_5768/g.8389 Transcript_5768/m.8389 type:complete len:406 (-) Transcript_5768:196-1413(-)
MMLFGNKKLSFRIKKKKSKKNPRDECLGNTIRSDSTGFGVNDSLRKNTLELNVPDLQSNSNYTEEYCKCVMVTGGVGFVGSHVVETLLQEGRKVVIYDIFNSETSKSDEKNRIANLLKQTAEDNSHHGASLKIVTGDIRDQEKIMETVKEHGVTGCIHVGGMVDDRRSVAFPDEYINVNILGTAKLLDALGKCGVKMVVQASTRSVFGQRSNNDEVLDEGADRRPINPYGASKVGADAMAHCYSHLHNMNLTLVRIFATYGPRGRPDMMPRILIESIVNDKPIPKFGDGTATRTWIYVSDIVSAFLTALKHPQGGFAEFNTGAHNSTTLNNLIDAAEVVTGKNAIIEHHPAPPGDAHTVGHPNYDKIQKVLGWTPKVSVTEGMRMTYEDYISTQQMDASKQRVEK